MAGRGGRGAALFKALEEQTRRPGGRPDDPAIPVRIGRGAALGSLPPPPATCSSATSVASTCSTAVASPSPAAASGGSASPATAPAPRILPMGRASKLLSLIQQKKVSPSSSEGSSEAAAFLPPQAGGGDGQPDQKLDKQMAALSVAASTEPQPPPEVKKMHGEKGRKVPMTANYIRMKVSPGTGIFEYHITFNPQIDSKNMRFKLMRQLEAVLGKTRTFDGAKLYLPKRLSEPMVVLNGSHPVDESPVSIYVKFICQKTHQDCIHLYNVLFRRIMVILKMTQVGRHYYSSESGIAVPQHKLEVWPGYITAVDEFEGGLMLLCDVSHRVLQKITVLEKLMDLLASNRENLRANASKHLLGCIVMTTYNNKTYRVDEIQWDQNPNSTFKIHTGEDISYKQYYKKTYNLEICDDEQPLLLHREKPRKGETITKLISLVPELCVMTGLTDEMRADFKVMKDIAAHTRVSPAQRQYAYRKFVENVQNNEDAKYQLSSWGLELERDTIDIPGRIMDPETIIVKNRRFKTTPECDWGRELTREPSLVGVVINIWAVIFFTRDQKKVHDFVDTIKTCGRAMGIMFRDPKLIELRQDRNENYINALREVMSDSLQIVVIVFPSMREDRYSAVKKFTCIDHPVPSQVINARTIGNPGKLRSVTQKIALQMNCKMGGELWALEIPMKNLMVCGIDVYHDASRNNRSVAGFVASINGTLTRWYSRSCFQEVNQELVDGLRVCLVGALKKYYDVNHTFPDRVFIFRDGVGDGQLNVVAKYEVEQLAKAFSHIDPNYEPKLSVVIVQKRINTRLFAMLNGNRQLDNPPPGTVIDHTITRKSWYDFFLVSQHVRQGTVSPTHYVVVYDHNNLKPDQMQQLSYKLTHLYYNWPGTVRVPAPCQYAHKLAALVGQNLHKEAHHSLSDRLFFL